jgi:hypothetical protein
MNFAYLDTRSLLESVLAVPQHDPIPTIPCELGPTWESFSEELGKFKMEFVKAKAELTRNMAELNQKREEINVLKMMIDNINSEGLKEKVVEILDNYESEEGINALTQQCGEITGRLEAMKKVLLNTGAERYARFTCFVCMDKLVDLFIDPCGHVICDSCWVMTKNKDQCPGCRGRMIGVRKIYTMN